MFVIYFFFVFRFYLTVTTGQRPPPLLPEDIAEIQSVYEKAKARQEEEQRNQSSRLYANISAIRVGETVPVQPPSSSQGAYGAPVGTDLKKVKIFGCQPAESERLSKYTSVTNTCVKLFKLCLLLFSLKKLKSLV